MLVEFTVGNYRSFKDPQTLSLEATPNTDYPQNYAEAAGLKILKSVGVYGANASGKSNLMKAFQTMQKLVFQSGKTYEAEVSEIEPFALVEGYTEKPSLFEVVFTVNDKQYKYGFEITQQEVVREYCSYLENGEVITIFSREGNSFQLNHDLVAPPFNDEALIKQLTKKNVLLLTVLGNVNEVPVLIIPVWQLFGKVSFISGHLPLKSNFISLLMLLGEEGKSKIYDLMRQLDLGIKGLGLRVSKHDKHSLPDFEIIPTISQDTRRKVSTILKFKEPFSVHSTYSKIGDKLNDMEFDLDLFESDGTKSLFAFAGLILACLEVGATLFADEIDASLHPFQTLNLISMFNSSEINPNNAQLIFTTHDTNILKRGKLRSDQIYFTEKNRVEATELYSLAEFKDADSKNETFEEDYLNGRFGAIPFINGIRLNS